MAGDPHLMAFLQGLGWPEMLFIAAIMLLLFGRRLPEVARSAGRAVVQFKKGLKETEEQIRTDTDEDRKFNEPAAQKKLTSPDAPKTVESQPAENP